MFIQSGCISYLQIQKTQPPEIILNEDEQTIQFVNFYDYTTLNFDNEERTKVYISGVNRLIDGLERSFAENPEFSINILDSLVKGRAATTLNYTLNPDSVKYYCLMSNADMLLALEAFEIYYDKDISVSEDENGNKSKTANYYLIVKPGLTLYDKTGNIINSSLFYAEEFIDSRAVILLDIAIRPSYAKRQEEIDRMAFDLGFQYINKFYPTDYLETRSYFTNKNFAPIVPYIQDGNWNKAIEMLLPLAGSGNKKEAKRAAKNLGVVYEALGDMDSAEKWYAKFNNSK